MNQAIILGCSHAAGTEMDQEINVKDDAYGCLRSYPALIANKLKYTVRNHAIAGGSNDAMFRIGSKLLLSLDPSDIIIACWTGPHRTEIYHETNQQWLPVSLGNPFYRTIPDDIILEGRRVGIDVLPDYNEYRDQWCVYTSIEQGHLNKIKNIYALNAMAHELGIKVINLESFGSVNLSGCPSWINRPVDKAFCTWAEEHQYPKTKYGHYFTEAHKEFAEVVVNKLRLT